MTNISVFNFESFEVRFVGTPEKPEWIAQDVADVLEIQNIRQNLADFDEDEKGVCIIQTKGGKQKKITLTLKGLKRLITKSRMPNAKILAQELGIEVLVTSKEQDSLLTIMKAFKHLKLIPQYFVLGFRLDLYLPEQKIAIECDEWNHRHIDKAVDKSREDIIIEALGCKFIRFNPNEIGFDIGNVINKLIVEIYK